MDLLKFEAELLTKNDKLGTIRLITVCDDCQHA